MSPRLFRFALPAATIAAAIVFPSGTPAATGSDCSALRAPGKAREIPVALPGGVKGFVRDPYGGQIARNRLFVQFSFHTAKPADRDRLVDHVDWTVDGAPPTRKEGGKFAYLTPSTRFTVGTHALVAHVVLKDGTAVESPSDTLTVSDCQFAALYVDGFDISGKHPGVIFGAASGGPSLKSFGVSGTGVRATLPASARGRTVGSLQFYDGQAVSAAAMTLKVPNDAKGHIVPLLRKGTLLVRLHPGLHAFLDVLGIPKGKTGVRITLKGAGARIVVPAKRCARASFTAAINARTGKPVSVTTNAGVTAPCF